jgi:molybdopterin-guanine dinucleotide biosynthesis protein A
MRGFPSLRQVLEPGLFIMVKERSSDKFKPSAREVREYADRIIQYDGETFDIDIDDFSVVDGTWALKMDATAIIMAGGKSSRMGREKCMLPIDGRPMIEHICNKLRPHFKQFLISANDADRFSFLGIDVIADRLPDRSPLMGIASALEASIHDVNVVIACDMPDIDVAFVKQLLRESKGYEGVVPVTGTSRLEPMCAVYRKSVLKTMNEALSSGDRKVSEVLRRCKIKYIEVSDAPWFRNINTMKDYEDYIASKKKKWRAGDTV